LGSVVLLGVLAALALLGGTARAARAATCPPPPSDVHPFTPWNDANSYVLTTGGGFEPGTPSWALSGGASVVSDNAPNALDPASDAHALYLPAGSVATSACVTAPNIVGVVRFFAKSAAASGGQLKVQILVKGGVYDAGIVGAGSTWAPSPMLASNAPNYSGAVTYQVRFTALSGAFVVDDVYFDPYVSRK
jgi:hypothetical protein